MQSVCTYSQQDGNPLSFQLHNGTRFNNRLDFTLKNVRSDHRLYIMLNDMTAPKSEAMASSNNNSNNNSRTQAKVKRWCLLFLLFFSKLDIWCHIANVMIDSWGPHGTGQPYGQKLCFSITAAQTLAANVATQNGTICTMGGNGSPSSFIVKINRSDQVICQTTKHHHNLPLVEDKTHLWL